MSKRVRIISEAVRNTVHRIFGTKAYYDDLMINAEQILIVMVAVLMRYIGRCETTDELTALFEPIAWSFTRAVNDYITAACRGANIPIGRQLTHTIRKSNDDTFLEAYQKILLEVISRKFVEHQFTRVVPGAAAGEDVWEKWIDPTTSFILIDEFFGSVFLYYYLGAIREYIHNGRMPKTLGFADIERIRLCFFPNPQSRISETVDDIAYYGDKTVWNVLGKQMPQIGALSMLLQVPAISRLVGHARVFSSRPCSSPSFCDCCQVFTHLKSVLPLFDKLSSVTMSRTPWQADIHDAQVVKVLNSLVAGISNINDSIGPIQDYVITESVCQLCAGKTDQRRAYTKVYSKDGVKNGGEGFIVGPGCSKLCPNMRTVCTSCAYSYYKIVLKQHHDTLERRAQAVGRVLPQDFRDNMPENLRCPYCSESSFGAVIVPFSVDGTEYGGIKLHPIIDLLMLATKQMEPDPEIQEEFERMLEKNGSIPKPSLKGIVTEFKNTSCEFFHLQPDFCYGYYPARDRWMLLIKKINDPTLAQFIPNFVVIQKGDIYCFGSRFLDMLEKMSDTQDRHQKHLDHLDRETKRQAAARERSRSRSPRGGGNRLNRRTKKRSHGKNLPKSKSKSIKSKSKSKKYNKTKSNRL